MPVFVFKPNPSTLLCLAVAAFALASAGCGRKPARVVAHDPPAPSPPRATAMTSEGPGESSPRVVDEWRMQRGRFSDVYRLTEEGGRISGEVDAGGIGSGIAVNGTLKDGHLMVEWTASGSSAISEDGKADYRFRFEGDGVDEGFRGTATLTGHHLANGVKVPVADPFQALLRKSPSGEKPPPDSEP